MPRKSVVSLTDRPDMTLDVYRGRKTTMQQQQRENPLPAVVIDKYNPSGKSPQAQNLQSTFKQRGFNAKHTDSLMNQHWVPSGILWRFIIISNI